MTIITPLVYLRQGGSQVGGNRDMSSKHLVPSILSLIQSIMMLRIDHTSASFYLRFYAVPSPGVNLRDL